MGTKDGTNGGPALAARYSEAFAAYLNDRGEQALGAAYDLGREAVAAKLSVLDLADAHHSARCRPRWPVDDATLDAAADFLRESLSTFETVHRGYLEVQEVARLEHEYVEQLRALADASVAINSTLTVEAILQLTADTARTIIRAARATVAILAPDPRLRPLTATSPAAARRRRAAARAAAGEADRPRQGARGARGDRRVRARSSRPRDEAILTQLAQLASVAISNAQLYERERTIARTLQRSLRPGGLPPVKGLSAAVRFRPAGEGIELGGDFYDLFEAGDGAWTALIGDVQGKGPDAAAVTALARHTMRAAAAYESRPSGVLALLHRALRDQTGDEGRFCTVCYAHLRVGRDRVSARAGVRRASAAARRPRRRPRDPGRAPRHAARLRHRAAADRRRRHARTAATCSSSTPTASPRSGAAARRSSATASSWPCCETCAGLPPDAVADRVEAAVMAASEGRLRDDMAILAFGPTPQPKETDG